MDTRNLAVGSRIDHGEYGTGTVTFVGVDYLGIAFDEGGEALIRRDALESEAADRAEPAEEDRAALPWPESTFAPEGPDARHFLGSHWEPFFDDVKGILGRLSEIVATAKPAMGYGESRKPSRTQPPDWRDGFLLLWPSPQKGLALILRPEKDANVLSSLFPFFAGGSQQRLTLRGVSVWDGGLEAQITAGWGASEVTFFDSQYLINRTWYEAGEDYELILSGIAYDAGPAERREWTVNRHPDEVAWMNLRLQEGGEPVEATCTVTLDVAAALLIPISEWDVDDYSFRGPAKSVADFTDWLGQDGWRVRVTVMRLGDEDADLDILITRRAWSGAAPPQVGQAIEGRLWLQGYLWMPG